MSRSSAAKLIGPALADTTLRCCGGCPVCARSSSAAGGIKYGRAKAAADCTACIILHLDVDICGAASVVSLAQPGAQRPSIIICWIKWMEASLHFLITHLPLSSGHEVCSDARTYPVHFPARQGISVMK